MSHGREVANIALWGKFPCSGSGACLWSGIQGAIFSNLTHDHLDYHETFLEYLQCKKRLFDNLPKKAFALINIDDKNGEVMVQNCRANIKRYSCRTLADFNCKILEESLEGMMLAIGNDRFWTQFIGVHNAYNLLAVYATAILLGATEMRCW